MGAHRRVELMSFVYLLDAPEIAYMNLRGIYICLKGQPKVYVLKIEMS
jgi:hypothetical protein